MFIGSEIGECEKKILQPHTYPEFHPEMLELLKKEEEVLVKCLDSQKKYTSGVQPEKEETKEIEKKRELTVRQKVEKAFAFMQGVDLRKHKQILDEKDFDNLINWVTSYFENEFVIPEISNPIHKVNTNKGNVIYTFMSFFKELHPASTRPDSLFNLIKCCFNEYRNDKLQNLKKHKQPQYYDDLISKYK